MDKPTRRRKSSGSTSSPTKRAANSEQVTALLDALTDGEGAGILSDLFAESATAEAIARRIATGSAVEVLAKLARTNTDSIEWITKADYDYVGLPQEAELTDFRTGFETYVRKLLHKRADGFSTIFDALDQHKRPLIIETGCLRVPCNWDGDGQSTFLFDWYARERNGSVITIDANAASIESARRACSSVTSTILNDSVAALIYLDSFDLDVSNPMPSAIHHAMEMMAARGLFGPGTILCVDDFNVAPLGPGGKGLIVDQFLTTIRTEVLYSGYQKVWRISS